MRLIDADALFEVIKKSMAENPHKEETQRAMHIHEHKYFLTLLAGIPTIQPEPHEGYWIEGGIYRDVIECNCSECGQLMTTAATVRMNFCPNCGAKMTISTK